MTKARCAVLFAALTVTSILTKNASSEISSNVDEIGDRTMVNFEEKHKEPFINESKSNYSEKFRRSRYLRTMPHRFSYRLPNGFSSSNFGMPLKYNLSPYSNEKKHRNRNRNPSEYSLYKPHVKIGYKWYLKNDWRNNLPELNPSSIVPYLLTNYAPRDFVYEEYDDAENIYNKKNVENGEDTDGRDSDFDNDEGETWYWKNYPIGEERDNDYRQTISSPSYKEKHNSFRKYYIDSYGPPNVVNRVAISKLNGRNRFNRDSFEQRIKYDGALSALPTINRYRQNHGVKTHQINISPMPTHLFLHKFRKFPPENPDEMLSTRDENQHRFKFSNSGDLPTIKDENVHRDLIKFRPNKNFRKHSLAVSDDSGQLGEEIIGRINEDDKIHLTRPQNVENAVYSSRYRNDHDVARNMSSSSVRNKISTMINNEADQFLYSSPKKVTISNLYFLSAAAQNESKWNTESTKPKDSHSSKKTTTPPIFSAESNKDFNDLSNSEADLQSDQLLPNELIAYMSASPTEPLVSKEDRFSMSGYPFLRRISERDNFYKTMVSFTEPDFEINLDRYSEEWKHN